PGIAERLDPGGAQRAAPGRIDHKIRRQDLLALVTDPDANATDCGVVLGGKKPLYRAILDRADVFKPHEPAADVAFQHRPRGKQSDHVAGRGLERDAMPNPGHVISDIAPDAAGRDDLVGPAGEE